MKFWILLITFATLTACDPKEATSLIGGTYDGFAIEYDGANRVQTLVSTHVNPPQNQLYAMTISDGKGKSLFHIAVDIGHLPNVKVTIPEISPLPFEFRPSHHHCFETPQKSHWALLCFSPSEMTLDLRETNKQYTLILDSQKPLPISPTEAPAQYTRNQLIDRAINQSFASRTAYEKLMEAKVSAKSSFINVLTPHFSTNAFIGLYSPTFTSMLKVIGDLAPFLLPNRWAKAKENKLLYQAKFNGWMTIKADAGQIVAGLSLLAVQNEKILSQLQNNKELITEIRNQIAQRENSILQIGSSDDISEILNVLEQAIEDLKTAQENTLLSLSHATGFINPQAILKIKNIHEGEEIRAPQVFDEEQLKRLALERSYELKELGLLVKAAGKEKIAREFSWTDPNGDANGSLGFGIKNYFKVSDFEAKGLKDQQENVESLILTSLGEALNTANSALKKYAIALTGQEYYQRNITRLQNNLKLGITFTMADLVNVLKGKLTNDINLTQSRFQYAVSLAKINRLIYAGPFARLSRAEDLFASFEDSTSSP